MSDPATDRFVATRTSLHRLAEHVLAAELHRRTGRIGLRAHPGGFGTPAYDVDGVPRQVWVDGAEVVVADGPHRRHAPITTLAAAADLVGIPVGGPAEVYELRTDPTADDRLLIDPAAVATIADLFAVTAEAATRFTRGVADPPVPTLWPEHFDLAIQLDEVNYGGSPGDDDHDRPYLYVGPWTALTGDFWNESFGASLPSAGLGVESALAFFEDGQRRAHLVL